MATSISTDHGVTTLWSDSQCSQPIFYEEDANLTPPRTAYMDPIYCTSSVPRVYQIGAAIPAPAGAYYETSLDGVNETCKQSMPTPQGGFYAISPVDMSVSRAPEKVSGRRLQIIHFAGNHSWRDRVLYDTHLKTECAASRGPDGTSRCYPTTLADAATLFSDPLCTTPIHVAFPPPPASEFGFGCAQSPMPAYAKSDEGIRPVLGSGPQDVYDVQGASCATVQMGPMYLVGDPLPESAFATVHGISYP